MSINKPALNFTLPERLTPEEDTSRLGAPKSGVTKLQVEHLMDGSSRTRLSSNRIAQARQHENHPDMTIQPGSDCPADAYLPDQQDGWIAARSNELRLQTFQAALHATSSRHGLPVQQLEQVLRQFRPLEFIERMARAVTAAPYPTVFSAAVLNQILRQPDPAWSVCSILLALPNGMVVLSQLSIDLQVPAELEESMCLLAKITRSLATEYPLGVSRAQAEGPAIVSIIAFNHCLARLMNNQPVAESCAWAANAWRNGLLSTTPDSPFMAIDARLCKLGTWIRRMENPRWYQLLLPWWKKTPFPAFRFGFMGADRTDVSIHQARLMKSIEKAIQAANQHLCNAKARQNGIQRLFMSSYEADRRLRQDLGNFLTWVRRLNDGERLQQSNQIYRRLKRLGNRTRPGNPLYAGLVQILDDMRAALGHPDQKIHNHHSKAQVLAHLAHVVDNIQGASRARYLSGGQIGLGTKGVSIALTSLFSGLLARLKLDLRHMRLRQAGIEIAMPPYNLELAILSSTGMQTQGGLGLGIGPNLGPLEILAGGQAKLWASEKRRDVGVVLRMPRVRGQEAQLKIRFKAMLKDLMDLSRNAENDGSLLRTLLARYPELSVNSIARAGDHRQSHGLSVEVSAGLNTGLLKLGVHAEAGLNYHSRLSRQHLDANGATQVQRDVLGQRLQAAGEASIEARAGVTTSKATINLATPTPLGVSAELMNAGRHIKRDIVYQNGKISTHSFYEIEYQSFHDFRRAIESRISAWSQQKALQAGKPVGVMKKEILGFLNQAALHRQVGHTYAARCELRPVVAEEIDAIRGWIELNQAVASSQARKQMEWGQQRTQQLLNDRQAYRETSFRVYDRTERQQYAGLRAAARVERVLQAEGVYAHSRLM